ncbi:MAG: ATP-binding protein [Pedobacter sp.]|nr:ATP-binding protein [Pedobacter sp.]
MCAFEVNLSNCDSEPIHISGQIQSHGFMIVINEDAIIQFYSNNINHFLPHIAGDLLGKSISYVESFLGEGYQSNFIKHLISSRKNLEGFERINPIPINILEESYYLIISISEANYVLEFELSTSSCEMDIQNSMGTTINDILIHIQIEDLLENAVVQVKEIINFDRVMVYRFAEDGHGEVIAEAKNPDLSPWIGLHYPASDIPKQARELYKLNLTRLIADVETSPCKICKAADNPNDLDLTYSQLRAVSPIHIQYLKNMGVASSFSISLKYKDELWGLIACHNYTPNFIDYKSREYAKLIGQILSSAIEFRQNEETMRKENELKNNLSKVIRQLLETESMADALTGYSTNLSDIVKSSGAALVYDKSIYKLGDTPDNKQLIDLIFWVDNKVIDSLYETDNLSAVYPEALTFKNSASGLLISRLYLEKRVYLIWFRGEKIQTVNWAGNPNKQISTSSDGLLNISPRTSFERWTETTSGFSESWSLADIKSAITLGEEITYGVNHRAVTTRIMNERLKLAYEELETFSYTISHDLKNPIASIKSYAQLLIRDQNILERGQQMLQRIADRADQMNLMINAVLDYSRIGRTAMLFRTIKTGSLINDIVRDLELIYELKDLKVTIGDTPDVKGDPIMVLQVFSNLISNAVKYSQRSSPPKVHISGKLVNDKVHYAIKDNGIGIAQPDLLKIFELFNRMENVKDIEGSGVGLAIVKRIVEKHQGTIVAESELGIGSTFHLTFHNADS